MSNILMIGSLGHIGSSLLRRDWNKDDNITIVDNLSTQRYCSLFNLPKKIKFIEDDFANISSSELKNYDLIVHLAAITNAEKSFDSQEMVKLVNVDKTQFLFEKVMSVGKKILFPSSTSVYGEQSEMVNEDSALNPQSPYAESKIAIEELLAKSGYKNYIILRLGTIFGISPGMRFHTAINKFCYQAAFNRPLTVWKDNIDLYRPYLGLHDLHRAFTLILKNYDVMKTNIYNVITDNYKLSVVLQIILNSIKTTINYVSSPLLNQLSYKVSIDKIKRFGYEPKDDITAEIKKTLAMLGIP